MSQVITVSVDSAGRLLLPEAIREEVGLSPGVPVEINVVGGRIEMAPAARGVVRVVRRGRLTVAVADDDLPPLTEREVLSIREELHHTRSAS